MTTNNTPLDFLSKLQLIQPFCNRNDGARETMVSAHTQQFIPILDPQVPKCASIYNNTVVECSTTKLYKSATEETIVLAEVELEGDRYAILNLTQSKIIDMVKISDHVNEGGFTSFSKYDHDKTVYDEGDIIRHYGETDKDFNLNIGVNSKVAYVINGNNFEDAFVVSQGFADKMTHVTTDTIEFVLNSNEYFLNLYGDNVNYSPFPKKGESKGSRIICAKRKIKKAFTDNLTNRNLSTIHFESDEIFYSKCDEIESITVFANNRNESDNEHVKYINHLADVTTDHIKKFLSTIDNFMRANKDYKLSSETSYNRTFYSNIVTKGKKILFNDKEFSGYYFKIKLKKKVPLEVGSKITSFHASKGLVTKIVPDDEMLTTADGEVIDVIFNVNSVIGRLNLGQINEVLLNKISRRVEYFISKENDVDMQFDIYMKYICNFVDDAYLAVLENILESKEAKKNFIDSILKSAVGIVLPITPFTRITMETYTKLLKDYVTEINSTLYKNGKKLKNKVFFGELYLIKLKHEPEKKMSYSSFNKLQDKTRQPTKDQNSFKKHKSINTFNPSSIAEMELSALLTLPTGSLLKEELFAKSSDENLRVKWLASSLYSKGEVSLNEMEGADKLTHVSVTTLKSFLNVLGLSLEKNS